MQPINHNKPIRKKKGITKPQYKNLNPFKAQEKRYKLYYGQQTDYSGLYNYHPQVNQYKIIDGYKVYELPFPKGAYYVENFNDGDVVMDIGLLGLNVYCKRPYRTNLDSRQELYKDDEDQKGEKLDIKEKEKQQGQEQEILVGQQQINQQIKQKGYSFNDKIRWANVGYQYDWTLRKYPQKKTPIHPSLQQLSSRANKLFNSIQNTQHTYEPQSAIINYYSTKDYMTGHLDDAEIDQVSPIYSFSFGLSCVFVIGGSTKEEKPTSVRLNSGDLLIMSGYSRRCYHGVPRVIENSFGGEKIGGIQGKDIGQNWVNREKQICQYFQTHRININIRQVYPKDPQ